MHEVSNCMANISFKNEINKREEWIMVNEQKRSWESEIMRLVSLDSKLLGRMQWTCHLSTRSQANFIAFAEKHLFKKIANEQGFKQINFFNQIKQVRKERQCGFREAIDVFKARRDQQISSYCSLLGCSTEKGEVVLDYVEALNQGGLKANQLISELEKKFKLKEIRRLFLFIKDNKENWEHQVLTEKRPVYIRQADYSAQIPRTLQYNEDGTVHLLFNKVEQGDLLLGEGASKRAKLAIELTKGEIDVRATEWIKDLKEIEIINQFKNCLGIIQIRSATLLLYSGCPSEKEIKVGYMLKYYNGGDLDKELLGKTNYPTLQPKEKFLIAKYFLSGLEQVHQAGILHRDLKAANLLLSRDPVTHRVIDCVVADFGYACKMSDKQARLGTPGTPFNMAPEYFLAAFSKRGELKANDFPQDRWGAGVILYQLFKKEITEWDSLPDDPPWFVAQSFEELEDFFLNLEEGWLPRPQDPNSVGHVICDLLTSDPKERISVEESLRRIQALEELNNLLREISEKITT